MGTSDCISMRSLTSNRAYRQGSKPAIPVAGGSTPVVVDQIDLTDIQQGAVQPKILNNTGFAKSSRLKSK